MPGVFVVVAIVGAAAGAIMLVLDAAEEVFGVGAGVLLQAAKARITTPALSSKAFFIESFLQWGLIY
jgi:hypothetical protein